VAAYQVVGNGGQPLEAEGSRWPAKKKPSELQLRERNSANNLQRVWKQILAPVKSPDETIAPNDTGL